MRIIAISLFFIYGFAAVHYVLKGEMTKAILVGVAYIFMNILGWVIDRVIAKVPGKYKEKR